MVIIDVIELVALDHIELYGNDMIGGITIVGLIEKAKVLAWKSSWKPSRWGNHKCDPMTTHSWIFRTMAKTKVVEKEKAMSFNEFLKLIGVG